MEQATSPRLGERLTTTQIAGINQHLDNLLRALWALTEMDDQAWQAALTRIHPDDKVIPVTVTEGETNKGTATDRQLEIATIRSFSQVISELAADSQELLCRAVSLIEQCQASEKDPSNIRLLADYLQRLRHLPAPPLVPGHADNAALTPEQSLGLLTELLFYSSQDGPRRLWDVLLITAQNWVYETG